MHPQGRRRGRTRSEMRGIKGKNGRMRFPNRSYLILKTEPSQSLPILPKHLAPLAIQVKKNIMFCSVNITFCRLKAVERRNSPAWARQTLKTSLAFHLSVSKRKKGDVSQNIWIFSEAKSLWKALPGWIPPCSQIWWGAAHPADDFFAGPSPCQLLSAKKGASRWVRAYI